MITVVQKFKTEDGEEFLDRVSARRHEVELEAHSSLSKLLDASIKTGRVDAILRQILVESPEVSAILQSYRKKYPKPQLAEAA